MEEVQVGENYMDAFAEARELFTSEEIETYEKEVALSEKLFRKYGVNNVTREQLEQAFIDAGLESVKQ